LANLSSIKWAVVAITSKKAEIKRQKKRPLPWIAAAIEMGKSTGLFLLV
jgi:hypothetical protein